MLDDGRQAEYDGEGMEQFFQMVVRGKEEEEDDKPASPEPAIVVICPVTALIGLLVAIISAMAPIVCSF